MSKKAEYEFRPIPTSAIESDPENPRKADDQAELDQLCTSIDAFGIMVPIAVREVAPGRYMVIDGHRRLWCARRLALPEVECQVFVNISEGDMGLLRFRFNRRW